MRKRKFSSKCELVGYASGPYFRKDNGIAVGIGSQQLTLFPLSPKSQLK